MACTYNYKGHFFSSELALDDFLLEREKYLPKLGDIVFDAKTRQNHTHDRLLEIAKTCEKLKEQYDKLKRSRKLGEGCDEDGENFSNVPPYIGVNRYLAQERKNGSRYVPEFKDKEYWTRREKKWKEGSFTDEEKELFGLPANYSTAWSEAECKTHKDEILKKWQIQALTGTAVHEVLQLYFSPTEDGKDKVFNLADPKQYILDHISAENMPYLKDQAITDAIKYASNLMEQLRSKYGKNAIFFPEFSVDGNAIDEGTNTRLYGIIDLLIIDENGTAHILDYKTSIKEYGKFDPAKRAGYQYQLATYQRMLQRYGIDVNGSDLWVAPIQITEFRKEGGDYTYNTIDINTPIKRLNSLITQRQRDNIDLFMPPLVEAHLTTQEVESNLESSVGEWFKDHSTTKLVTEKQVIYELKRDNLLTKKEGEDFIYKPKGSSAAPITAKTEPEFIQKVLQYKQSLLPKRIDLTQNIKKVLRKAIEDETPDVDWPLASSTRTGVSATWLRDTLSPYCHPTWRVKDNDVYEKYGIITLENIETGQIDLIRISTSTLDYNYFKSLSSKTDPRRNRLGLLGNFEPDVVEQSNSRSLMVEATNGNIELMETMALLNLTDGLENSIVGNIRVINPYDAKSIQMSNEELFYCFNKLNQYKPMSKNKFDDNTIQLASKFRLTKNKLADILRRGEDNQWKDSYMGMQNFKCCTSVMDQALYQDSEKQIEALTQLLKIMQNDRWMKAKIDRSYTDQAELQQDIISLYNSILISIADLKGINFRQQLEDHGQWLESAIHLSGTYIDNPGNLSSETLNLVTRLVTEAYQNTRQDMQRKKNRIKQAVEKLKQAKGFSYLQENIGFNQADLYKNLFVEKDGDIKFKFINDSSLSQPEREFLDFALKEINSNRHDWDESIMIQKRDSYDEEYYRVPLAKGASDSVVSSTGFLQLVRDKLSQLHPKTLVTKAKERVEEIQESLNDSSRKRNNIETLYRMTNTFDGGEDTVENRKQIIKTMGGIFNVERNMESLLLKHDFAYAQQQNLDAVFPLIKAATVHLAEQGAMQNDTFKQDLKYVEEYIKSKIFNESIVNPENQKFAKIAGMIKKAASMFTLAFSPVQMLYQPMQGLWQDISLMIRKPDGKQSFTFNHFKNSLKLVYGELLDYSGKPTMCSLINELYGINDMDMNTYVDRISHSRKGLLYNFDNFAFKFASRPDYYNRMSIFLSQMQGDGCLEAHTVEDGVLKYNWKLDKRFSKFAADPTNKNNPDPEYQQQRSLYYAIAQQFANEHARDYNGKEFVLDMNNPQPLPRAYTNKQAESMKSLADDIYGYYSHEKKSMIMSTAVGSMWLQFKTYWSGKKNQYLQKGGVRLRGNWEQYTENINGKQVKYYYQTNEKGEIEYNKRTYTEEEMKAKNLPLLAPVLQWKGQWQEGILVTMGDIFFNAVQDPTNTFQIIKDKWNTQDENLQRCYRSNIKQLGYDVLMFMVIGSILGGLLGDWLKELKEDNKDNTDFIKGLQIAGANIAVLSVKNSFMDFNFINSVGSPAVSWTPFAIEWAGRQYKNIAKVATGDEDIWDGVMNIASVNKQIKPMIDTLKPEQFRTKREGGTWESATARKNRERREGTA